MMVSTRGRYALRILMDLAEHDNGGYIPIKDVTTRQAISHKYTERIMALLAKNGLVESVHGQGGGYRLTRKPAEYRVGEILRVTEGDLAPVSCLSSSAAPCARKGNCKTIAMWSRFNELTNAYFDGITLADLMA